MTNIDLINIEKVRDYMPLVEKRMNLQKDIYTVGEAADYFFCNKSQIRGFYHRFKDIIKHDVLTTGMKGKQTTTITKAGMFLLALLLKDKSVIATDICKVVEAAYAKNTGEQTSFIENDTAIEDVEKVDISALVKDIACKILLRQADSILEAASKDLEENRNNLSAEKINKMENDLKVGKEAIEKAKAGELEDSIKILEDRLEEIHTNEELEEKSNKEYCECACQSPITEFDTLEAEPQILLEDAAYKNARGNIFISSALERCVILGIDKLEAAILVQNCIVNENVDDMDSIILDYLIDERTKEFNRKKEVLREWINLFAKEKCDGDYAAAYKVIVNDMKYVIGNIDKKNNTYLDVIVKKDGYESAIEIIGSYLSE